MRLLALTLTSMALLIGCAPDEDEDPHFERNTGSDLHFYVDQESEYPPFDEPFTYEVTVTNKGDLYEYRGDACADQIQTRVEEEEAAVIDIISGNPTCSGEDDIRELEPGESVTRTFEYEMTTTKEPEDHMSLPSIIIGYGYDEVEIRTYTDLDTEDIPFHE